VITRLMILNEQNLLTVATELANLEQDARRELVAQGAADERIETRWLLDLRYRGQAYELTVAIAHAVDQWQIDKIADDFGRVHERRYGHRADAEQIEIVNLRVSASFSLGKPRSVKLAAGDINVQPRERRDVTFLSGTHLTPVLEREKLPPGFAMDGPVIIEEKTSTVVVEPGWKLTVDDGGNLLLFGGAKS